MSYQTLSTLRTGADNLVVSIYGQPKSGKSTFYIGNKAADISHWPLPMYITNYDHSLAELLGMVPEELDGSIFVSSYEADRVHMTPQLVEDQVRKIENDMMEAIRKIKSEGRGTIVVDTMTGHWDKLQRATVDKRREQPGHKPTAWDYGEGNSRFNSLVMAGKSAGANMVLVHHAKEVWEGGAPTGLYVSDCSRQVAALIQMELLAFTIPTPSGQLPKFAHKFTLNRFDMRTVGEVYEGLDYRMLYDLTFGKESPYV